ncbi:MAG: hypothetical protein QME74_12050 [Candidatus Edwardsbacteria bacterium]|nr:hypothetical protein [Candidatus Edwardsbacteria bacterium]
MIEGLNSEDLFYLLAKMGHDGSGLTPEEGDRFLVIMADKDLRGQVEESVWRQANLLVPKIRHRFQRVTSCQVRA